MPVCRSYIRVSKDSNEIWYEYYTTLLESIPPFCLQVLRHNNSGMETLETSDTTSR